MNHEVGRPVDASVAIATRRRRIVLACLSDDGGSVSFDALVEAVAERERHRNGTVDTENVAASLHHVHLPTLDAAGFVDYDREANHVELASVPDGIEAEVDDWFTV